MSIIDGENEFDGDDNHEEPKLQWASFKQYHQLYAVGTSVDHSAIKSMIDCAFPDQEHEKEIDCRELSFRETVLSVPSLASILCDKELCASQCEVNTKLECSCRDSAREESVCTWQALLHSFFRKKTIDLSQVKWRTNFLHLFTLKTDSSYTLEKNEATTATRTKCSLLDVSDDKSKTIHNKPDPIYSGFGKLKNGFYVSSSGLVFSSEAELTRFNAKMAEMDKKFKHELHLIKHQHSKLTAKTEERKLLPQRTESQESDHDEEPRENQKLNKEYKPKDKVERKSGLFASLQASLSAAKTGIQGFWDKSSPKDHRCSTQEVPSEDNDDSEDDTGKLTHRPNSKVPEVDGFDNHDEFTREMEAKGGLTYKSADRTVQQLSHDALPPPLSLRQLQAGDQSDK